MKNKLFSGESINIEYKVEMPKKSEKYMKTVVAFANGRGGRIVFGVDGKTLNIVGMNPDTIFQTMDSITNAISDSCEHKIYPDVTLQSIDDKTIIVVEIFAYMKIIEKWGTGIPRILRECKEYGLKKPELIDFDGDFRVNMYRREEKSKTTQTTTQTTTQITTQTTIKLTKNDHEILQVIQNNPALSQKEIAMELGWTVDRVKYYLNKMKKQEAIRRIGSSHKGYWKLLIKL
ncbi:RNA-binding domain-containing protein [Anaerostipes hadrus]|uniref:RNA-binding domain-containing protein n=1 Tax=Anaerostipes hadrus TaxID=649756 RepID=UPI001FD7B963|nr:RNA-binding domain-containing protein [Anaerostipes hadrus]